MNGIQIMSILKELSVCELSESVPQKFKNILISLIRYNVPLRKKSVKQWKYIKK